jgi:hypothetical protein
VPRAHTFDCDAHIHYDSKQSGGRTMQAKPILSLAIASAMLLAASARAHHSFSAEFDAEKPLELTGTVTKIEWQNPHTWFYIDVMDDDGNVSNWGLELASPNLLMRNGWTRSSMKTGDVVHVAGFHAKNGEKIGNARTITLPVTGQTLFTGSSSARSRP